MTYRIFKRPIATVTSSVDLENQRMAEIGRLSANFIHEISNPLSTVMIQLEQHKDSTSANFKYALSNMRMLIRYVDAMRQQIRAESSEVVFSVNSKLQEVKRITGPIAKQNRLKIKFEIKDKVRMYGDPVKFQQIIANLLLNAVQAYSKEVDYISREILVTAHSCKHHLHLKVHDWGQGIDAQVLPMIFLSFFTTKSGASQGLGMGLTIVRNQVCGYFKGSITVKSTKRGGTVFNVKLPLKIKQ